MSHPQHCSFQACDCGELDADLARARNEGYEAARNQLAAKLEADARQVGTMRSLAATETARFLRELVKQVAAMQPEEKT